MEIGDHIFVSYAKADADRVALVVNQLQSTGLTVWLDRNGITGGTSYATEIAQAIATCKAFVLICTANAFESRNVKQEVALAWNRDRPIMPLRLEAVEPPLEFEYWLEASQWVDAFGQDTSDWSQRFLAALGQVESSGKSYKSTAFATSRTSSFDRTVKLPVLLTPLIGRRDAIDEVLAQIRSRRIVTLVGPGGVGKTSLAIASAGEAAADFEDGAIFVDLASVENASNVQHAIARELGILEQSVQGLLETLVANLRNQHLLLVLDNFEQVTVAAPDLSALARNCPNLTILVTSRVALRVQGETVVPIEPLETPPDAAQVTVQGVLDLPAVQLFVERARDADPGFHLNETNAQDVVEIVQMLDGLPLGIELAAARVRLLPPDLLKDRMQTSTIDISGNRRDAPQRQRTLRDTIAWSYQQLEPEEQLLLRRLSIFAGGCIVAAAIEIGSDSGGLDSKTEDSLESLLEKSLLRLDDGSEGNRRIRLLTPVREFAREQLFDSGEAELIANRHAAWFMNLSTLGFREINLSRNSQHWLQVFDAEISNLRATLEYLVATGRWNEVINMICDLGEYLTTRPLMLEGLNYLKLALNSESDLQLTTRLQGLAFGIVLAGFQLDRDLTLAWSAEASSLALALGDREQEAIATYGLANMWQQTGQSELALPAFQEALKLLRLIDWPVLLISCLADIGDMLCLLGRAEEAKAPLDEALELSRSLDYPWGLSITENAIGYRNLAIGKPATALNDFVCAYEAANGYAAIRLELAALAGIAAVAADLNHTESALKVLAAIDAQRERLGVRRIGLALQSDRVAKTLQSEMDPGEFARLWQEGEATPYQSVVEAALAYAKTESINQQDSNPEVVKGNALLMPTRGNQFQKSSGKC